MKGNTVELDLHCDTEAEAMHVLGQELLRRAKAKEVCGTGFAGEIPNGIYRIFLDCLKYNPDNATYSVFVRGVREGDSFEATKSPDFAFTCCFQGKSED